MLRLCEIALCNLEEKIDTHSAAGESVFHVFGAMAHFEWCLIAERTKDGIAAARARGKRPGCQPLDAGKIASALKLVQEGLSPTAAAMETSLLMLKSQGEKILAWADTERGAMYRRFLVGE